MRREWRRVIAVTFVAALVTACGVPGPSTPDASVGLPTNAPRVGRSVCPGSVSQVGTNLAGAAADTIERLGSIYQEEPGVLAVVWDGRQGVIVVEAGQLDAWRRRLAPRGIAVAPSCVDPALLATVRAAFDRLTAPKGTIISAGYDGLDDAISVLGVDTDVLLAAMEAIQPGARAAALAAIADGTLRISEQPIIGAP